MTNDLALVGIDCATNPKNVGIAFSQYNRNNVRVLKVSTGSRAEPVAEQVARFLTGHRSALVALDAPLGWPGYCGET